MGDWRIKGRAAVSFLADLGGALAFVVAAVAFVSAAVVGAALAAWTAFPQPYLTLLVLGVALAAAGIALHLLRGRLSPPPQPAPAPRPSSPDPAQNPYSQAALLQQRHESEAKEKKAREGAAALRRAVRRVREELLDNERAIIRSSSELDELLHVSFNRWREEQSTLLDADNPEPHERASEAYRRIRGVLTGRVHDDEMSSSYASGSAPTSSEISDVQRAIDKAVLALQAAETKSAPADSPGV